MKPHEPSEENVRRSPRKHKQRIRDRDSPSPSRSRSPEREQSPPRARSRSRSRDRASPPSLREILTQNIRVLDKNEDDFADAVKDCLKTPMGESFESKIQTPSCAFIVCEDKQEIQHLCLTTLDCVKHPVLLLFLTWPQRCFKTMLTAWKTCDDLFVEWNPNLKELERKKLVFATAKQLPFIKGKFETLVLIDMATYSPKRDEQDLSYLYGSHPRLEFKSIVMFSSSMKLTSQMYDYLPPQYLTNEQVDISAPGKFFEAHAIEYRTSSQPIPKKVRKQKIIIREQAECDEVMEPILKRTKTNKNGEEKQLLINSVPKESSCNLAHVFQSWQNLLFVNDYPLELQNVTRRNFRSFPDLMLDLHAGGDVIPSMLIDACLNALRGNLPKLKTTFFHKHLTSESCNICTRTIVEKAYEAADCLHKFCQPCLEAWQFHAAKKGSCPSCDVSWSCLNELNDLPSAPAPSKKVTSALLRDSVQVNQLWHLSCKKSWLQQFALAHPQSHVAVITCHEKMKTYLHHRQYELFLWGQQSLELSRYDFIIIHDFQLSSLAEMKQQLPSARYLVYSFGWDHLQWITHADNHPLTMMEEDFLLNRQNQYLMECLNHLLTAVKKQEEILQLVSAEDSSEWEKEPTIRTSLTIQGDQILFIVGLNTISFNLRDQQRFLFNDEIQNAVVLARQPQECAKLLFSNYSRFHLHSDLFLTLKNLSDRFRREQKLLQPSKQQDEQKAGLTCLAETAVSSLTFSSTSSSLACASLACASTSSSLACASTSSSSTTNSASPVLRYSQDSQMTLSPISQETLPMSPIDLSERKIREPNSNDFLAQLTCHESMTLPSTPTKSVRALCFKEALNISPGTMMRPTSPAKETIVETIALKKTGLFFCFCFCACVISILLGARSKNTCRKVIPGEVSREQHKTVRQITKGTSLIPKPQKSKEKRREKEHKREKNPVREKELIGELPVHGNPSVDGKKRTQHNPVREKELIVQLPVCVDPNMHASSSELDDDDIPIRPSQEKIDGPNEFKQ